MTKVNGNDGMSNFYYRLNPFNTSKIDKSAKTEQAAPAQNTEAASTTFDFSIGSKQTANQIRGLEVEGAGKIPAADQKDLDKLAELAGIKSISVPQTVYGRIDKTVAGFGNVMDEITAENNTQKLFASEGFQTLNDIFGIA